MTFKDRKPTRPNRFKVTPENGEPYFVTLERADEPTEQGTPLNAENLNSLVKDVEQANKKIDELPKEPFVFTLEDGSTVTKAVYVG